MSLHSLRKRVTSTLSQDSSIAGDGGGGGGVNDLSSFCTPLFLWFLMKLNLNKHHITKQKRTSYSNRYQNIYNKLVFFKQITYFSYHNIIHLTINHGKLSIERSEMWVRALGNLEKDEFSFCEIVLRVSYWSQIF